uniref:Uncharacterized protein n=1 Tax=Meloidogyne enterolobii TaxID=390850 RepID=A0A6V7VQE7_MELEN|nr:unnamed protein product [Meloidogyne enterolobii]
MFLFRKIVRSPLVPRSYSRSCDSYPPDKIFECCAKKLIMYNLLAI